MQRRRNKVVLGPVALHWTLVPGQLRYSYPYPHSRPYRSPYPYCTSTPTIVRTPTLVRTFTVPLRYPYSTTTTLSPYGLQYPTIPLHYTPSFGNTLIVQQRRNKVLLCLALSWYLDSLSAVESTQTLLRK